MSTIYICDRCGKEASKQADPHRIRLAIPGEDWWELDLCPTCFDEIESQFPNEDAGRSMRRPI